MNTIFWFILHTIMFAILLIIWVAAEVVNSGKDIGESFKNSENKSKRSISENVVIIIILLVTISAVCWFVGKLVLKNPIVSYCFVILYLIVYAYIGIRQIIRIIFWPEKRDFSDCDIRNYMLTYMFWWLMVVVIGSLKSNINLSNNASKDCKDIIETVLLLLYYYFNILFLLGGIYLLAYYVLKFINSLVGKKFFKGEKKVRSLDEIRDSWVQAEKIKGLKSYELWKENKRGVVYKILMTLPIFILDMLIVPCTFLKIVGKTILVEVVKAICDPIRAVYRLVRGLWSRYKNNEWMYVLAQIAGLCSYVIVFVIVQYGDYKDEVRSVYEFVGTIILIPYFLNKLNKRKEKNKEKTE